MAKKPKIKLKYIVLLSGILLVLMSYLISKFSNAQYLLEVHSEIAGVGFAFIVAGLIWLILGKKVDL